jgi:hypothetical protein
LLSIENVHSTSMRPQAKGTVARMTISLIAMLSKYCQKNQSHLDMLLPMLMLAYDS